MSDSESLERSVARAAEGCGLKVGELERSGPDFTMQVERGERPGRILCLGPGTEGRAVRTPASFFRLELGRPDGSPSRMGVVDSDGTKVQAVAGPGWIVVGAPQQLTWSGNSPVVHVVAQLMAVAEHLERSDDQGSGWAFASLEQEGAKGAAWYLKPGGAGLLAASALTYGAPLLVPWLPGLAEILVLGSLVPYVGVPLGIGLLGAAAAKRRALLAAHAQGRAAARALKACGAFDSYSAVRSVEPLWPPVVLDDAGARSLGAAVVRIAALDGRSKKHDLTFRLRLHAVSWPLTVAHGCKVLDDGWATMELQGPGEVLAGLPSHSGEERSDARTRWCLPSEALARGAFEDLVSRLGAALTGPRTGPYR